MGRATQLIFVLACGTALVLPGESTAQDVRNWDNGADAGPGVTTPESGDWTSTEPDFNDGAGNQVAFGTGNEAVFGPGADPYDVTLNDPATGATIAANDVTVTGDVRFLTDGGDADSLSVAGTLTAASGAEIDLLIPIDGALALGGAGIVRTDDATSTTGALTNAMTGTLDLGGGTFGGGFTQSGDATTTVSDATSFGGDATVGAGTFSATSTLTLDGGDGTLTADATATSLSVTGGLVGNLSTATATTVSGDIDGVLTVTDGMTQVVADADVGEQVDVLAGTLEVLEDATLTAGSGLSNAADGTVTVADGAELDVTAAGLTNQGAVTILEGGEVEGDVENTGENTTFLVQRTGVARGTVSALDMADVTVEGVARDLLVDGGTATLDALGRVSATAEARDGQLTLEGGRMGALVIGEDGVAVHSGSSLVDNDVTNAGTLRGEGTDAVTLFVGGTFTNSGDVTNDGSASYTVSADDIVLNASSDVSGVVLDGDIDNSGVLVLDTGAPLGGSLTNQASGEVTVASVVDAAGNAIDNAGRIDVQADQSLTGASSIVSTGRITVDTDATLGGTTIENRAGGEILNAGTLQGAVTNAEDARLATTGTIEGNLDSAGILRATGTITGTLTSTGDTGIGGALSAAAVTVAGGETRVDAGGTLTAAGGVTVTGGTFRNSNVVDAQVTSTSGGTVVSTGTLSRGATLAGTSTLSGIIAGDATNAGSGALEVAGPLAIGGALTNAGNITGDGTLSVEDGFTNGGTATLGGALTADLTNGGIATLAAGVTGDVVNDASGDLNVTGDIDGTLTNAGTASVDGNVTGAVSNTGGTLDIIGTRTLGDGLSVTGGAVTAETLTVVGATTVDGGGLTTAGNLSSATVNVGSGGAVDVGGVLTGDVVSAGDLTVAGGIVGNVDTTGIADLGVGVSGNLTNGADATLTLSDTFDVGGAFDNAGDLLRDAGSVLTVADGYTQSDGILTLNGTLASTLDLGTDGIVNVGGDGRITQGADVAGVLNLNGRLDGGLDVLDGGVATLSASGTVGGATTITGRLAVSQGATLTGAVSGSGTLDLADGVVGDQLVLSSLDGDGMTLAFDLDLTDGAGASRSDTILATGAVTGDYVLSFSVVPGTLAPITGDILLVSNGTGTPVVARLDPDTPLPNTARTVFTLQNTAAGDLVLRDQINPAIGALAGNIALTQSLIGTLINRPTSPFVVGLAGVSEPVCSPGVWSRASAGTADAEGQTRDGVSVLDSEVDATYRGLQIGGDFACFNGAVRGFDLAVGAIAGINTGETSQPIFQLDSIGGAQTGVVDSVTESSFDQTYLGLYVTGARGPLVADLQLRRERTDFTFNNRAAAGLALGVTDQDLTVDATTLSGSVSRSFPIGEQGWSLVPTAGFSITKTDDGTLRFDDGSTLSLDSSTTQLAFLGGTASRTRVAPSGNWAANYFVTGTYYADFSDDLTSVFEDVRTPGETQELSSSSLGDYGELSVGVNYIRLLNGTRGKQFNASARIDARASGGLTSVGLTAQARWQF